MDANARGVVLREQLMEGLVESVRKSCVIVLCAGCNEGVIRDCLTPGA